MLKQLILKWLFGDKSFLPLDDSFEFKAVERVEQLLARRYNLEGVCSQVEDIQGLVNDLEWKMDELREYDLWDMSRSIEDHTSAIETLEERLDAIYSPEGYELTLTAKVKGVQDA
jgi:hypothetical protein